MRRRDRTSLCVSICACTPVEAAENVETSVFSPVKVHAEDGGEDEQHHGEVEHHHHCSLQDIQDLFSYFMEKVVFSNKKHSAVDCFLSFVYC